jgi:hypothetical protein
VLKQANRIDARYVAWMHEDGSWELKDMQGGEQLAAPGPDAILRDVLRGPVL